MALLALTACDTATGQIVPDPDASVPVTEAHAYYDNYVSPTIVARCGMCHGAAETPSNGFTANYDWLIATWQASGLTSDSYLAITFFRQEDQSATHLEIPDVDAATTGALFEWMRREVFERDDSRPR